MSFNHTVKHEEVHRVIAVYSGCDNYTVKIGWFGGSFSCHSYDHIRTEEERRDKYMLDSINEIVSYNLDSLHITLILCFFTLSVLLYKEE